MGTRRLSFNVLGSLASKKLHDLQTKAGPMKSRRSSPTALFQNKVNYNNDLCRASAERCAKITMSALRMMWIYLSRCVPNMRWANRMVAGQYFRRVHGRLPLAVEDAEATINDFIFERMTGKCWTDIQRLCVDKVSAPWVAQQLAPRLRVAARRAVLHLDEMSDWRLLRQRLDPFAGENVIAKPAHGSGTLVDLRDGISDSQARNLYISTRKDYFWQMRETQYANLPRRLVLEQIVTGPKKSWPDDYKFMCVHGRPLVCQVDRGRLAGTHVRRLFRIPEFVPYMPDDGIVYPGAWDLPDRSTLLKMIEFARQLSAPFDYVRVDLLLGSDIFFGEFTFSQGAALGCYHGQAGVRTRSVPYNRFLLEALRDESQRKSSADGDVGGLRLMCPQRIIA